MREEVLAASIHGNHLSSDEAGRIGSKEQSRGRYVLWFSDATKHAVQFEIAVVPLRFRYGGGHAHISAGEPGSDGVYVHSMRPQFGCAAFGDADNSGLGGGISQAARDQSRAECRSEEHTSELQSLRHLVCRL